jgi:hypothetical protein
MRPFPADSKASQSLGLHARSFLRASEELLSVQSLGCQIGCHELDPGDLGCKVWPYRRTYRGARTDWAAWVVIKRSASEARSVLSTRDATAQEIGRDAALSSGASDQSGETSTRQALQNPAPSLHPHPGTNLHFDRLHIYSALSVADSRGSARAVIDRLSRPTRRQ